ncbi:MAG TPA: hypothetical protein VFQ53_07645 [Kofleriaceae bacterium]|nr:hypothetical protein [Kofleriaceae bacterium]
MSESRAPAPPPQLALPIRAPRRRAAEVASALGYPAGESTESETLPGKKQRREPRPLETTARMSQPELLELVRLTSGRPRRTSEMQRPELIGLLRQDLELDATPVPAGAESDRVVAIDPEATELVGHRTEIESRLALGVAFLAAVFTGVLLTIPFW